MNAKNNTVFHVGGSERKAHKRLNENMGKIYVPLPLLIIKKCNCH